MSKSKTVKKPRKGKKCQSDFVILSAGEIDILISRDDPWYPRLSQEFPNERPFSEEDDLLLDETAAPQMETKV